MGVIIVPYELAIQAMSELAIVSKIKDLLQHQCSYFSD